MTCVFALLYLLKLGLATLRHLDHNLTPSLSRAQSLQRLTHLVQTNILLILKVRPTDLARLHKLKQSIPNNLLRLGLVISIRAPVQANHSNVLEQQLVHRDLLNRAAHEADNDQSSIPSNALGALIDQTHGVVNDVDTLFTRGESFDFERPLRVFVVDAVVSAETLRDVEFVLRACCGHDGGAECFGDLHGCQSDTSSSGVDQHPIAGFDVRTLHERSVRCRHRDEQARRFEERPTLGHGLQLLALGADDLSVAALGCAEDFVADGIVWALGGGRGRNGGDHAAELRAADPGEGRLVLVFAADLQQVEEVCRCAVDADCVLVGCWGRVGQVGYAEVLGSLEEVSDELLESLLRKDKPRHILLLECHA